MPELEALAAGHGLGILEDACEALGAVDSEGRAGRRPRQPRHLRLLRQQADDDGGGGDDRPPRRRRAPPACARERNQGRAADMGWLDHDRLGFNYRLSDLAAALGVAQVEKLDALLERRAAVAAALRGAAWPRSRACEAPIAGRGAERRSWFVYTVRLAAGADRDATIARLAERGIASQGLPALHPPLPAPARARLPRGPVPGRRSRRRAARWRCPSSRR